MWFAADMAKKPHQTQEGGSRAAIAPTLADMRAELRRLREEEADCRIELQRIAEDRERLLDAESAELDDFDELRERERDATEALRHASLAASRIEGLVAQIERKETDEKTVAYRAELLTAAGRIEAAVRKLLEENTSAEAIFARAASEISGDRHAFQSVAFHGMATEQGLGAWLVYLAENIFKTETSSPLEPMIRASAEIHVPEAVNGRHAIVMLRSIGRLQPGDVTTFPAVEAEAYVKIGFAAFKGVEL